MLDQLKRIVMLQQTVSVGLPTGGRYSDVQIFGADQAGIIIGKPGEGEAIIALPWSSIQFVEIKPAATEPSRGPINYDHNGVV